jgi:hypothetical protein
MPGVNRLQIYSLEQHDQQGATYIVRCIGGTARVGQVYVAEAAEDAEGETASERLLLTQIERYRQPVKFFGAPHTAMVYLSGGGGSGLPKGSVLANVAEPA